MKSGIYMWTSPSGKSYIGQATDLSRRKKRFERFNVPYAGAKIECARRKYNDIQYWTYTILERCGIDDLDKREVYYINYYGTVENGYNSESGGCANKILSDETKCKLSEINKGANHPMWGKHHCEESKHKISKAIKGKHHNEETKRKISESLKGRQLTEEHKRKLSDLFKGENHPMFGVHRYGSDNPTARAVLQYTKDGQFVAEYSTIKQGAQLTNTNSGHISDCCRGKRKSAGGYIWKYKEEGN